MSHDTDVSLCVELENETNIDKMLSNRVTRLGRIFISNSVLNTTLNTLRRVDGGVLSEIEIGPCEKINKKCTCGPIYVSSTILQNKRLSFRHGSYDCNHVNFDSNNGYPASCILHSPYDIPNVLSHAVEWYKFGNMNRRYGPCCIRDYCIFWSKYTIDANDYVKLYYSVNEELYINKCKIMMYLNYLHTFNQFSTMQFYIEFIHNKDNYNNIPTYTYRKHRPVSQKSIIKIINKKLTNQLNVLLSLKSSKVLKLKLDKL